MNLAPIFLYGLPILTVFAVGLLGSTRRIGFWLAVILSVVLTPIGGFVVALLSGPKKYKPKYVTKKTGQGQLTASPGANAGG
ncbi:hypothetical protein [Chondromyces crocatus]|uniref:Uncharacterized protein n=1 Tax=Chondromyces crocatus TaxID=52 RepID=A0A0K1ERL2_CHOCO|nr:hypothetical protein [Chondromyces crocatus]AKT43459.1 uncharacterized protein CMC5_076910 [Chondromyces crocatus]